MHPDQAFPAPEVDPSGLYRVRDALYTADLLIAALVHLDLFTLLARRPLGQDEICRSLGLASRPADVMLTLFAAMNLLEKKSGLFEPTPLAREQLVRGSPWHLGPYYASFKDRPICQDLLQVLRTGKPAGWGGAKDEKDWARAMEDPAFAEKFTAAMDCRGAYLAPAAARKLDLRGSSRLLDVAGGSGIYACAVVDRHPHMRAVVLEKPPVDEVAASMIAKRGFADGITVVPGDMFAGPLPAGFDAHLFSNVLHDWDVPDVKSLLGKSWEALPAGGRIIIHDAHLNREKTGPIEVAEYSVLLVHSCEGRCYSVGEMETCLEDVGFAGIEYIPTVASRSLVVARKAG